MRNTPRRALPPQPVFEAGLAAAAAEPAWLEATPRVVRAPIALARGPPSAGARLIIINPPLTLLLKLITL